MEYSFPFREILKDIYQINSGYPGYLHEYSFSCKYLHLIKNILDYFGYLFLDIPDAPDPSLPCRRPYCFATLPSATFPGSLSVFSAEASLNLKTYVCQIIKQVFTKCAARVAEGAPPWHRPRKCSVAAVVARADPTSQVPTCLPSRRKTCRDSQTFNPHPHPPTLLFRFSSKILAHVRKLALVNGYLYRSRNSSISIS